MILWLASARALWLWIALPTVLLAVNLGLQMPDWTYGTDGPLAVWVMEVCRVME